MNVVSVRSNAVEKHLVDGARSMNWTACTPMESLSMDGPNPGKKHPATPYFFPTKRLRRNLSKPKIEALEDEMFLLREQVDEIAASLRRMQKTNQHFNGSLETQKEVSHSSMQTSLDHIRRPVSAKPRFVGPTSSDYNFSMANNALQTMGIQTDEPDWEFNAESAGPSRCPSPGIPRQEVSSRSDPLLSVGMEESYRALEVYKEELSQVYPFIPVEKICQLVPSIFEYLQLGSSFIGMIDQNREVDKEDVNILKMIVASALILEGRGKSRISQILVDSIGPQLTTSLREVNFDLKELQVLTMTVWLPFTSWNDSARKLTIILRAYIISSLMSPS